MSNRLFATFFSSTLLSVLMLLPSLAQAASVYVADAISPLPVKVIDTATNAVTTTVSIPGTTTLHELASSPDGSQVYVTNGASNSIPGTLEVIDAVSGSLIATVPVGNNPIDAAASPDGARIYVSNLGSDTVSVIDAATFAVISTIPVGDSPAGIAVSPDNAYVIAAHRFSPFVSLIDASTNTVINIIGVGNQPWGVGFTLDGARAYVANSGSNSVSVIDVSSQSVAATIAVGSFPIGVAMTPDGTKLYVANQSSQTVSVIATATDSIIATIPASNSPTFLEATPDGSRIYVTQNGFGIDDILVIDTATDTVSDVIQNLDRPHGIAIVDPVLAEQYACLGFEPPLESGPVTVRNNRVLPLKALLRDSDGQFVDDLGVAASPVIEVMFDDGQAPAVDVTDESLPAGAGTEGNQFEHLDGKWHFNLKTRNYTSAGTYTIHMRSGDSDSYVVNPTCVASFVIQ